LDMVADQPRLKVQGIGQLGQRHGPRRGVDVFLDCGPNRM
jgi:hypothetical protein